MTDSPAGRDIVQLNDVAFYRGSRRIFKDLNITIREGEITAVMGPSGTGKTTLLQLITGQLMPDEGTVTVFGHDLAALSRGQLYEVRKQFGMLFQQGALLTDINVFENVAFPLREHTQLPERLVRHIVLTKLHAVGLRGAWQLSPNELSGGMARRVALARAMVMDPELLIYDEPFVGLDPISMGVVVRLIRRMNDALNITSIVVSHDVQEVSLIADKTYLISDGKVAASGRPSDLAEQGKGIVAQFMNGMADGPVPFHFPAPDYNEQMLTRNDE